MTRDLSHAAPMKSDFRVAFIARDTGDDHAVEVGVDNVVVEGSRQVCSALGVDAPPNGHVGIGSDTSGAGNLFLIGTAALTVSNGHHAVVRHRCSRHHARLMLQRLDSPLLSRQKIYVEIEGELVKLVLGNATIRMPYETALQLSQFLRVRGKQAKKLAGDNSRHWSAVGYLEGLET